MACSSHKAPRAAHAPVPPLPGAAGWLNVRYNGAEPLVQYGQATRSTYPFEPGAVRYIDRRDAIYILNEDFEAV